jgi:DNA repair protein RadD
MAELYPHQAADLEKIVAALNAKTDGERARVLFQAATGYGKTETFVEIIKEVVEAGCRVLVLAHRDEIIEQISRRLTRRHDLRHGIVAPGYPETTDLVQVASVFTAVRRLGRLHPPTLIVVDEAHHAKADSWVTILAAFPKADVLGVTATPRRLDGKPLDDIFDALVLGTDMNRLIDAGYLAPVIAFTPPRDPNLQRVRVIAGDFSGKQLAQVMSRTMIIDGAVEEYRRRCDGAAAIAFCVNIAHSKLVAAKFREAGYNAEHVDGDTPREQRRALIKGLRTGSVDVLCNCGLISEGLDVPDCEAIIMLRPTKSLALYLQMVGRAMRPGKPVAFLLDHAGNVSRHGLPTARRRWSLHGRQQPEGVEGVFRCRNCGAVNDRAAEVCISCGAPLHQKREYVVGTGRPLAEAVETPITAEDIRHMTFGSALRWAADESGRFNKERLTRVANAKGYKSGWVYHKSRLSLDEALESLDAYKRAKKEGRLF